MTNFGCNKNNKIQENDRYFKVRFVPISEQKNCGTRIYKKVPLKRKDVFTSQCKI